MLRPLYFKKDTGTALVKLKEAGAIETVDKQFKSYSRGDVISFDTDNTGEIYEKIDNLIGKEVYFEEYKDSAQVPLDDNIFAFLAVEDIKGYNDVEA